MKAWVGVTDNDWYRFLSARPDLDEVNFWQPSGGRQFRALAPSELFLFKLHHPENYIVGGGVFTHFSVAPSRLAWDAFGEKNGAPTYEAMRQRIEKYKRVPPSPHEEYDIGCILLTQPFFFERSNWIPAPPDFAKNIVYRTMSEADADRRAALIGGYVARRRRRAKGKRARGAGALHGFVERRLPLRAVRGTKKFRASLRRDGRIYYKSKFFDTPNSAARAALGRPANGWSFWRYRDSKGEWVPLRNLKR